MITYSIAVRFRHWLFVRLSLHWRLGGATVAVPGALYVHAGVRRSLFGHRTLVGEVFEEMPPAPGTHTTSRRPRVGGYLLWSRRPFGTRRTGRCCYSRLENVTQKRNDGGEEAVFFLKQSRMDGRTLVLDDIIAVVVVCSHACRQVGVVQLDR